MTTREALARHPLAIFGALIATASAVAFMVLLFGLLWGLFERNPYAGLVIFVAVPAIFVIGLLFIPAGMWLQHRKLRRHPGAAADWPVVDFRRAQVRRTALLITALTAVNVVIVLFAGYGTLHWMESPQFCGQVCHTPMQPQFSAWQSSSHGRIACVECHIGEGAAAFTHAKLSGVRQLAQVATNSYPRPIPPGARMPEGTLAESCSRCHQPGHAVADRIRVVREYGEDESNTETMTVLQMHVSASPSSRRAIHWHADPSVRVEYVTTDAERQTIPYVRVTDASGKVKEYRAPDATDELIAAGTRRMMDCGDCHSSIGHPISPTAERAVDQAIAAGLVSRELPYARREGLRLLKASHATQDEGLHAIDRGLRSFYASMGESADQRVVASAVAALQDLYRRNVFPAMKVTWGTYPDNKGHTTSNGCFRCHDDSHASSDGTTISADCEYCHRQIER